MTFMPFRDLRLWTVVFIASISLNSSAAFWSTNAPVNTPRYSHTATLLNDGRVLIAGGNNGSYLASTEIYDPFTGTCSPGPNMTTNRASHTATLLPNGKVLVVGGSPGSFFVDTLGTAELFDPIAGTWTPTGSLHFPRSGHTATLLANGKVLVAGGSVYDQNSFTSTNIASAEIYDPSTGLWTQVNSMSTPRGAHTATLLRSGKVLVAAGYQTNNTLASAELFDPTIGTWSAAGTIPGPRGSHSAVLMPNGKVLIAGGGNGDSIATAALYDPIANSWTAANSMAFKRANFDMNLLPNGKVMVCGGWFQTSVYTNCEIFDPGTGAWTATASMNFRHIGATSTVLANGRVLVIAGSDESGFDTVTVGSVETYDSTSDTFSSTSPMSTPRNGHTATLLPNGKVLIAGGAINSGNNATNSAELFDPATGNYTPTGSMLDTHSGHSALLLANGKVLVVDTGTNSTSAELYDPVAGTWSAAGPTPPIYSGRSVVELRDGRVLVAAGLSGGALLVASNCYIFSPSNSAWTVTGSMNLARANFTMTLLTNGNVLAAGGVFYDPLNNGALDPTTSAEIYDTKTGTWSNTSPMHGARSSHTAHLLPSNKVLVAPGNCELYDCNTGTWTLTGSTTTYRTSYSSAELENGQVLLIGGIVGYSGGIFSYAIETNGTEIFDPAAGLWRSGPSLPTGASGTAATLLPTGKVLVDGGSTNFGFSPSVILASSEVYDPGLGFAATNQPQITSATSNVYSGSALVLSGSTFRGVSEADSAGTANSASDHPIVQLRAIESTRVARLVTTSWSSNACALIAPTNFPQGPALLTLFVNGIYSTSAFVNFSTTPIAVPFVLMNPVRLGDGSFRFNFTNTPGATFSTFASTNVAAPAATWLNLGAPTESSAGNYQFTDPGAATNRMRFYRVTGN
jgi:hypothetical protein